MGRLELTLISVAAVGLLIGIGRIYARSDGRRGMSLPEFQKMAAFILFYGAIIYMIYKEGNRERVEHIYGDLWMAFMITGLFSALHMDDILVKMTSLIDAIIRLRTKAPALQNESK